MIAQQKMHDTIILLVWGGHHPEAASAFMA